MLRSGRTENQISFTPVHVYHKQQPAMDAKVQQFVAVTGSTPQVARNMLEACAGNLDMAINMHLECGGGGGGGAGDSVGGASGPSSAMGGNASGAGPSSAPATEAVDSRTYEEM